MQHQAADLSQHVIAEVICADTSEVVYPLRGLSQIVALFGDGRPGYRCPFLRGKRTRQLRRPISESDHIRHQLNR